MTRKLTRALPKGKNIMTPHRITAGFIVHEGEEFVYELSEGTGMSNQPIFGVSVFSITDAGTCGDSNSDLGQLFQSEQEAMNHVRKLKNPPQA